jgi:uncharacterized protein with NAD-binding domain and iron-sulfur cluster
VTVRGDGGLTRRTLLRDAATLGAGAALAASPAAALASRRARPNGRTVAVLGGGMAGLAAAHELIERGFDVTVYESTALGGKARSIQVSRTAAGGRKPLPGEHGFRFFPGFYHHVPDTMRRIPVAGNPGGVRDNLVSAGTAVLSRTGREDVYVPFDAAPQAVLDTYSLDHLVRTLIGGAETGAQIPPQEMAYFISRLEVFLTSCDERRFGQWERTDWEQFVGSKTRSQGYQTIVAGFFTRAVVAAKESVASTRTIGNMAEAFLMNLSGRGNDGAPDRVLNAPTNEAWIDPWVTYLRSRGVKVRMWQTVEALNVKGGKIVAARVRDKRHRHRTIEADWFVLAVPPERAKPLISPAIRRLDPRLEGIDDLFTDWMVGVQFYLNRKVDIAAGHIAFVDAPWSVTALTQAQFWKHRDFARDYGNGQVVECLSADVSDWDAPGIVYGKPAKRCTRDQVIKETWEQMKAALNDTDVRLRDGDLVTAHVDPGVQWDPARQANRNDTPLLVNTKGSWFKRPTAKTQIPNLFMAGDHVQTNIDLATMEGANESGRAAVNALLDAAGSNAQRTQKYELYRPPEYEAAKQIDLERYRAGQPNLLDVGP